MKRLCLAIALLLALTSLSAAQNTVTTPGGANIDKSYDASNILFAPTSCTITVTTTATPLSTLLAAGVGDGCAQPFWAASAYILALTTGAPALCYSLEATLTSSCARGMATPGWTAWPLPAYRLTSTYFVSPAASVVVKVEWRG